MLAQRTSKRRELQAEYDRLSAEFGVLDVNDPSKFLITRIETNDPMHFLWRCYYPANLRVDERRGFGEPNGGGMTINANFSECLHRVRFDLRGNQITVHVAERLGGGRQSRKSGELVRFLKEHWSELEVQVLASDGTVEISTDRAMEFLTIQIPKDLLPELEKRVGKRIADKYRDAPFYQAIYGTPQAMANYDQQQAEGDSE